MRDEADVSVDALDEFQKKRVSFGKIETWFESIFPDRRTGPSWVSKIKMEGFFFKFEHFRTWRFWNKLLHHKRSRPNYIDTIDFGDFGDAITEEFLYNDRANESRLSTGSRRSTTTNGRVSPQLESVEELLEKKQKGYKEVYERWSQAFPEHSEMLNIKALNNEADVIEEYPSVSSAPPLHPAPFARARALPEGARPKRARRRRVLSAVETGSLSERKEGVSFLRWKQARLASAKKACPFCGGARASKGCPSAVEAGCGASERSEREEGASFLRWKQAR
jgi:hypothetical protein